MNCKLSASRISCLFRCPREYAYRYFLQYKEAPSKAMLCGRAFHEILEGKEPDLTALKAESPDYPWPDCLRIMLAGYKQTMKDAPGVSAHRELDIETDTTRLIVDEVRVDETDGRWWICENKTATREPEWRRIPRDNQAAFYTFHVQQIAEITWLEPKDWQGVVYAVTLKPEERRSKKESIDEFASRLTSSTVFRVFDSASFPPKAFDVLTRFAVRRLEEIEDAWGRSKSIFDLPVVSSGCERYGSLCPFFANCHEPALGVSCPNVASGASV